MHAWQVTCQTFQHYGCDPTGKVVPVTLMLQLTETYSLDQQFMFGPAVLVAPVMEPGSSNVEVFLPASERWFDAHTGVEVSKSSGWLSNSNKTTHQV